MSKKIFILAGLFLLSLFCIEGPAEAEDFESVVPGRKLEFPKDHGSHPRFKTEWWYFTGHLTPKGEARSRFGFELVFFRVGLADVKTSRSAWKVENLYLAHFALTNDAENSFFSAEKSRRGSFGEAGAEENTLHTWNGRWSAELKNDKILLAAEEPEASLKLELVSQKPIVLQGDQGFSQKGPNPSEASYYSSFTRLTGHGELRQKNQIYTIDRASVWMDQEFTSSSSGEAKIGWDWFALQLDSGEEIMLYQLRDKEDRPTNFSAGTFIGKDGKSRRLSNEEFQIFPLSHWKSPSSGIVYPAKWKLQLPSLNQTFIVQPTVAEQELHTRGSTGVNYWEGRSEVRDEKSSNVLGYAYVELVGYKPK